MKRKLKRQNGDIKLAVRDGEVKNLLQLTMLDRVFELYENQESAIQASEN
jgi:anti-anti-sigma regulatory factor